MVCLCAIISFILFASDLPPLVNPHPTEHIPFIQRHASSYFSQKLAPYSGLPVEEPLLIGSFNIQTLARKKFNNPDVMSVVEKVIRRYDLILIMEIMTETDKYMDELLADVNSGMQQEQTYDMVLSERRPETKEHYAFLYRKNKLKLISSESYTDPDDFYRKPLIAIFETSTLRDVKKFAVVGQHVKPAEAVREINGLAIVYDYIKNFYEIEDVLLMGDFNADCTYVKEGDWDEIALWYRSEFTWAIPSHIGTTTNYRSCSLDRFVYAGENMNDGVILSSAGIFNFQKEYDLTLHETRLVSDHWPIEIKIRSKNDRKLKSVVTQVKMAAAGNLRRKKPDFPVTQIHLQLFETNKKVLPEAAIYLAAVEEYLATKILEKTCKEAQIAGKNLIEPEHIIRAIKKCKPLMALVPRKFLSD